MITGVAIKHRRTGKVLAFPKPARHDKLIKHLVAKDDLEHARGEQGFITETGEFLNRTEALAYAIKCGQCQKRGTDTTGILFSEDVW